MSSNPHDAPTVAREISGLSGEDALTRVYVRSDSARRGDRTSERDGARDTDLGRAQRRTTPPRPRSRALLQTMTVRAVAALGSAIGSGAGARKPPRRNNFARGWLWGALVLGSGAIGSASAVLGTLALTPAASKTVGVSPTPSPTPVPGPSPTPTPNPSPTPTPSPNPNPNPSPNPNPNPSPNPTQIPLPYPIPNPNPILGSPRSLDSAPTVGEGPALNARRALRPPSHRPGAPRRTPELAADQLVAGDYRAALDSYRQLAVLHPDDPAYAAIAGMLERSLARRCDPALATPEAPCTP
jgi:hypothetical protein